MLPPISSQIVQGVQRSAKTAARQSIPRALSTFDPKKNDKPAQAVEMEKTAFVKIGNRAKLTSGFMGFCSTVVGSVHSKDGTRLGTMMCHRGCEPRETFMNNMNKELEAHSNPDDLVIKPIIFKTAPDTTIRRMTESQSITDSQGNVPNFGSTKHELAGCLNDEFSIPKDELIGMVAIAYQSPINWMGTECTVSIDESGEVTEEKPKSTFSSIVQEVNQRFGGGK